MTKVFLHGLSYLKEATSRNMDGPRTNRVMVRVLLKNFMDKWSSVCNSVSKSVHVCLPLVGKVSL